MPDFTPEQQNVIDDINDKQANGVEEPLLPSQDEEENRFSFKRLQRYLLNFLVECRNTLGPPLQFMSGGSAQMQTAGEVMGPIPPSLAAQIQREFAPERQAAVATYESNTSAILEKNGLFNANPDTRSMQENLLFGQRISQTDLHSFNLTPEQKGDALFISRHLQERFNERLKNDPELSKNLRPNQKAFVEKQFLAVGIALAMSDKSIHDVKDENGKEIGGAVLDEITDNMITRAKVTTERIFTPDQAVSSVNYSLKEYNTNQQKIDNESTHKMQSILKQEFTDDHGKNAYQIASTNPETLRLQNDLLAGKVDPDKIDFKTHGRAVLDEAAAKDFSQRTRHLPLARPEGQERDPGLILKVEALGLMNDLANRLNELHPGIDPRSMAIKEDVRQQIPSVALALALSPVEGAGRDVHDTFLNQMHQTATANYNATQNCLGSMPSNTAALSQVHTKSGELLGVATQTYTLINNTIGSMGGPSEPLAPTPGVGKKPTPR